VRPLALCVALLASLLAGAVPARAEWRRAVSNHFVIYSEASDEDLRTVAARLERFDGLLRRLTPVPAGNAVSRLTVYMPRSVAAIEQLLGRRGVGGFYSADSTGTFAVAPRLSISDDFEADVVLFHEYMHHFMLQHFSTAYPPWFIEGYAELFANARFERDGSIVIGSFADHRGMALRAPPPPLRDLLFRGTRAVDPGLYYANAWALTHYLLISDERTGQLNRYVGLVAAGRAPESAAEEAFGGIDALERDFRRYRRAPRIPTLLIRFDQAPEPGPIAIESLGRGEENLLWQLVEYRTGVRGGALQNLVRRVRARAAATPDDPATLQLLSDVEALAGNLAEATRAVDALLALQPSAPRALLRKGLIEIELLERGRVADRPRWVAARGWLRRANLAGPDDPFALFQYFRAFEREGMRPPPPAVAALERAFELVPQSFELRQRFARELIRARRFREAANVLAPVAYSAHGGARGAAAARIIDAIRALPDGAEPPPLALAPVPEPESR